MPRFSIRPWFAAWLLVGCSANSDTSSATTPGDEQTQGDGGTLGDGGENGSSTPGAGRADGDGDTIRDGDETSADTDGDGKPNPSDDDSDGDSISDADEAGDADPATAPVDSDSDGTPDFLDPDSDNDGVSDASEDKRGSDPTNPDSDGDGADDLTEIGAGTDPKDKKSNPEAQGDFFFRVPYKEPPAPPSGVVVFKPEIRAADVYFMMDSSISMQGEIDAVKNNLAMNILPGATMNIPDIQIGAGEFDNCPENISGGDVGVRNVASSTADVMSVATAMSSISANGGTAEPYAIAMWLWATGNTTDYPDLAPASCAAGTIGYGCVRDDVLPILVMIGDEPFSQGDGCDATKSETEVAMALNDIGAKLIVMGPTADDGANRRDRWLPIATMTGSVDETGAPLFFATESSTALEEDDGSLVVGAIEKLATGVPLELTAVVRDDTSDKVDAAQFIERVDAYAKGGVADPRDPSIVCVGGLVTSDRNADKHDEFFDAVKPGTPVCFKLFAKQNDKVKPSDKPQVFKAFIDVQDDFGRTYDTREIYFLVPPKPPEVNGPQIF